MNEQPLAELARRFRIGEFLLLGRGEETSGGRMKPSLLANAFESVLAAMYLDGGFDRTAAIIRRLFEPLIEEGAITVVYRDYKTAVQEIIQTRFREAPRYLLVSETGPDHDNCFETSLVIGGRGIATGKGKNKKGAEQQAARMAMEEIRKNNPFPDADMAGKPSPAQTTTGGEA